MSALAADPIDPATIEAHIATMTGCIQTMAALEVKPFLSVYYSLLAKLLMAAGRPAEACERLDDALTLAEENGVHFYDAEVLRLRAKAGAGGHADLAAIDLARRQGATIFLLRAAADDFELRERGETGIARCAGPLPRRQCLAGAGEGAGTARVSRAGEKVVILGGGMAGLSAAWRWSEPGWRDRFESVDRVVYCFS